MIPNWKIYPRSQGHSTVYLKNVVTDSSIEVGEYTMYDDFVRDPRDFQRNNVLYYYPECNHDKLKIGKFCSIACGAKFVFNAANHALGSPLRRDHRGRIHHRHTGGGDKGCAAVHHRRRCSGQAHPQTL